MSIQNQNYGQTENNLLQRHKVSLVWYWIFQVSTLIGIISLIALIINIINGAFGYIAVEYKEDPASLSINGKSIEQMEQPLLIQIIQENVSKGLFRQLERESPLADRTIDELLVVINDKVLKPQIQETWSLRDSLFKKQAIEAEIEKDHPKARLVFRNWVSSVFVSSPQSSDPLNAGVRTAIFGSLWTIIITILFALPVGVGAAIYLEEYSTSTNNKILRQMNAIIQTNINNLASVPSIIYGMLGLAIFVRGLEPLTSGAIFGFVEDHTTTNGRTILSAGLTLALLVLPLVIINAREAIRAVPSSLREASYGLGATKLQTIWHNVLPNAVSGILTGTILSISRAIGESAPLVVVGASTFITFDPDGPFSKFTTLPIQIYQWTTRPQDEFRNLAAAAILVLLVLLLTLNALAIILRDRYNRRFS